MWRQEIRAATAKLARNLPQLMDSLLDAGRGLSVIMLRTGNGEWQAPDEETARQLTTNPALVEALLLSGAARVYCRAPSVAAINIAFERVAGKVPQQVNVEVKQSIVNLIGAQQVLMALLNEYVPDDRLAELAEHLAAIAGQHDTALALLGTGGSTGRDQASQAATHQEDDRDATGG